MDNVWKSVSVNKFTDGVTDKITSPSKGGQSEIQINLIPQKDGSLKSRDGFEIWSEKNLAQDILQLWELQDFIIYYSSDKMFYYIDSSDINTNGRVTPVDGTNDYDATEYDGLWHGLEVNGELILTHKPSTDVSQRTSIKRVFIDASGVPKFETAQLPKLINSSGSVISSGSGTGSSYMVEVYWKRTYSCTVNGEILEKTIYGEAETATVESGSTPDIDITWDAFDLNNAKIATGIYDTDFTTEEYWNSLELVVGISDANENTTYIRDYGTIEASDGTYTISSLPSKGSQTYQQLGEVVNSTIPLGSYYNTAVDDKLYYGNVNGESDRIYQAKEDAPYHTSLLSFVEISSRINGLANFAGKPFAFTKTSTHRIEGSKSPTGTGSIYQRVVSDRYGCIAPSSIVKTVNGLVWFSESGICFTDGVSALIISENLLSRYPSWIDTPSKKASILGFYDEVENRVYWKIEEDGKRIFLVLDLYFGIDRESTYYIIRGSHSLWDLKDGVSNSYIRKVLFTDGVSIYKFDPSLTFDKYISGIDSYESPIVYRYKSYAINYGDNLNRKWTSKIYVNLKDNDEQLGVSFDINSYNDLSPTPHILESCHFYQRMVWDDSEDGQVLETQKWGALDPSWNESKMISFQRRFPSDSIRNMFKAIEFTNAHIVTYKYEDYESGRLTLDINNRTLVLPSYDVATSFLSQASIDEERYYLYTEEDDFQNGYLITGIQDDGDGNLNIIAEGDSSITEGELIIKFCEWKIKSISKNQVFHLLSFSLMYMNMGNLSTPAYTADSGAING